ncbi:MULTISPECIES: NAD(P)/FAD-dependent oxidoreductase [Psychrobacter]|uniref:FAD-binding oxidoreductase n=1 Tax=Psychrobacter halodurans TaxID=2818439 RepID=A0AAW4IRL2_9GAMM|nr:MULTISPECIES: FAD-dependent oxidoreductase [Psychrobacter]MBO1515789.1 FAD-binding oxidoreductase [Psychrobacter halodurans]MDN5664604.1 FAD-binding oxidoreductase [Psychrobacter sp.]OLF40697.1 amino acid dehydrogenase [Psychrobacter sp. Rd 27.2]PJX24371.1 amino acid dehydrogenase [Psychrobacter sp. L7]
MRYEVIVIGAGMVGTSIAWHLQKNNSQVLLLDKKLPGSETSYGNAGLIQREAIHTHPFPRQLTEMIRVLPNQGTDIRYRIPALLRYHQALLQYWKYSAPATVKKIEAEWQTLIAHCTSEHQTMISASGADELITRDGWLQLHRSEDTFKEAIESAIAAREQGVEHNVLSLAELKAMEPSANFDGFVGAIHWLNSWQVSNPSALVKAYAKNFEEMQGTIKESDVKEIVKEGEGWKIITDKETYYSDKLVIAAGPWSNDLIKPLGYNLPLFPMRGYHQHFKVTDKNTIHHSMFDMDKGFVMGPMQQGIRITTGAEMTTMNAPKNFGQLQTVLKFARKILPLDDAVESEAWAGSRPCMPDMKPVIGPAPKHDKLWFAFGHSHQGFTLGPMTGRIVEEMIHDKPLLVDITPFSAQRFSR